MRILAWHHPHSIPTASERLRDAKQRSVSDRSTRDVTPGPPPGVSTDPALLVELKRHVEVLSREIYGDWQKADNPGLRQRVAQIERIVAQVDEQYRAMTRALEDEER